MYLVNIIKARCTTSQQDEVLALIFLHHHIHEGLRTEYLTVKEPDVLWNCLKDIYDHLNMVILPKAQMDWIYLRLHDFKSVFEHNSTLFKITS